MKRATWWLAVLVGVALLAGCTEGGDSKRAKSTAPSANGARSAAEPAPRAAEPSADKDAARMALPATGQQQTSGAPMPGTDRKIVHTTFLDLQMNDVQSGFERIGQITEANGGLVAEANIRLEGDQRRATITIRVPVARYQDVLSQIRGLATKVESERANANDISEEYTDLQSRLRNLEATENQLLVFLGQAKNVQEVLQVQDRLNSTRAEIERVKGRINLLTRLTDLATIQAQLRPDSAPVTREPRGPGDALRRGWQVSTEVLGGAIYGVLAALAFSWWLLPFVAAAGLWLARREARRRATQHVPPVGTPPAAP